MGIPEVRCHDRDANPVTVDSKVWSRLECAFQKEGFLQGARTRIRLPDVIAVDTSPVPDEEGEPQALNLVTPVSTNAFLFLAKGRESKGVRKWYSRLQELKSVQDEGQFFIQQSLDQRESEAIRRGSSSTWQTAFCARAMSSGKPGAVRIWSPDVRYGRYCDSERSVRSLLAEHGTYLYPFVPPEIVENRYRMFRLFFVWNYGTENYDCVGGIAYDSPTRYTQHGVAKLAVL